MKRSLYWEVSKIRNAVVPPEHRYLDVYVLKGHRDIHDHDLYMAREARERRVRFLRGIKELAEDGLVALIESGRDCDGVEYSGKVRLLKADKQEIDTYIDKCYEYAEGPMHFTLERPSVAEGIQYHSRDLTMEAFEDGHSHVIYSRF